MIPFSSQNMVQAGPLPSTPRRQRTTRAGHSRAKCPALVQDSFWIGFIEDCSSRLASLKSVPVLGLWAKLQERRHTTVHREGESALTGQGFNKKCVALGQL
ncbi:MAG: hypothetical protein JWM16_237 [Verrucomicrobiales bacterium]|nr:hypothetical protein [Verrucomicrobiales bacterium]